ncbi:MAG: hypothetical protein EOP24_44185 [Hyphomicrobiales bacterium]|nr:MAG: hypothetical protein EOP24_44185 [Hyphomicrobiales bacterium]
MAGQAPVRKRSPVRPPAMPSHENATLPVVVDVDLDQGYYDRGIVARRQTTPRSRRDADGTLDTLCEENPMRCSQPGGPSEDLPAQTTS